MASKRTKALMIPQRVKQRVGDRDGWTCVLCGRPGNPEAHFISRQKSGLGIEENIVTLCRDCHNRYDQSIYRGAIREVLRQYLKDCYPDWNEENLIYKK